MWDDCLRAATSDSSIERIPHHHQARHPPLRTSSVPPRRQPAQCTQVWCSPELLGRDSPRHSQASVNSVLVRQSSLGQAHTWSPSTKTSLFSHVSRPNISFSHPLQKTAGDDIFQTGSSTRQKCFLPDFRIRLSAAKLGKRTNQRVPPAQRRMRLPKDCELHRSWKHTPNERHRAAN